MLLSVVSIGKGTEGSIKGKQELKWADVNVANRASQTPLMLALTPAVRPLRRLIFRSWLSLCLPVVVARLRQLQELYLYQPS